MSSNLFDLVNVSLCLSFASDFLLREKVREILILCCPSIGLKLYIMPKKSSQLRLSRSASDVTGASLENNPYAASPDREEEYARL